LYSHHDFSDLNTSSFEALVGSPLLFRLEQTDFGALGGKFKTKSSVRSKELYYRSYMLVHHTPLLRNYHNSSEGFDKRKKKSA
jgi:hypothetical protein